MFQLHDQIRILFPCNWKFSIRGHVRSEYKRISLFFLLFQFLFIAATIFRIGKREYIANIPASPTSNEVYAFKFPKHEKTLNSKLKSSFL